MLTQFFITINDWITSATALAALGCFLWGMVSVLLSPCHLASIPLVMAYVAGQKQVMKPRQAAHYAIFYTAGMFITIAAIGVICALLGRMLGDVGSYWQIVVGLILIWVALGMLGVEKCNLSGSWLHQLNVKGLRGAFLLGLAYGVLSGSCTFGFIAPILAIITVQQKVMTGVLLILLFALGHCLPIMIAGSSTAMVRHLTESEIWLGSGDWFRKGAGVFIALLGIYFISSPFLVG
jgi:cytochrome c-type biogenesis protein